MISKLYNILIATGLILGIAACAESADSEARQTPEDSQIESLRFSSQDGSIEPEYHTSVKYKLEGNKLSASFYEQYEDIIVDEVEVELSETQLIELNEAIADANLENYSKQEDDCDGGGSVYLSVEWKDGETIDGSMPQSAKNDGESRCSGTYTLKGDLTKVKSLLSSYAN